MTPAGEKAFAFLDKEKAGIYSHRNEPARFPLTFEKQFKKDKPAWTFSSSGTFLQKDNDPLGHECEAREDKALTAGKDNKHKCAA